MHANSNVSLSGTNTEENCRVREKHLPSILSPTYASCHRRIHKGVLGSVPALVEQGEEKVHVPVHLRCLGA